MRVFSVPPPCGFGTQGAGLHCASEFVLRALLALLGLLLLLIHSKEGKTSQVIMAMGHWERI